MAARCISCNREAPCVSVSGLTDSGWILGVSGWTCSECATVKTVRVPTVAITVYVAGDYQAARESLRRECFEEGLCVTVTPTTFIYTAGAEEGVVVGLVNYPRFPTTPEALGDRAAKVAARLMTDLCQWSALIVTPTETVWLNARPEDAR